jgi:hypothetical protein
MMALARISRSEIRADRECSRTGSASGHADLLARVKRAMGALINYRIGKASLASRSLRRYDYRGGLRDIARTW